MAKSKCLPAREVAVIIVRDRMTPHEMRRRFPGLSLKQARALDDIVTFATGPGGHGMAWAQRKVATVLRGGCIPKLDPLSRR